MGKSRVHHEHDLGYKYIFSHKETFLELLRGFVKKEWVNLIKSEDLILVDKSYILEDFSEEESDVVYRVNIEGEEIIFYTSGISISCGLQDACEAFVLYGGDMERDT